MKIGDRIKLARKKRGMTRPALAKAADIPYPTLAGIENGDQGTSTVLDVIAKVLRVRVEWLRTGKEPMEVEDSEPVQMFTKERRASDDVVALQIAVESLTVALLRTSPAAAAVFRADVEQLAKAHDFSIGPGLLGTLVGIADEAQQNEAAANQARRRAGSAGNTKP